jgi:tetratricopeptide (TPR) repeat protein
LTEAKAIARLNHHNIVQIFELERSARGPFIVMEYVEGGSLVELLKSGPLELERTVEIICQVCDGLGVAHDQGIIHRDIKPANILMTTAGVPKLSDFGLARQVSIDHGQTQTGAVLGTSDFMSPEQQSDSTSVDARSDLWSLAATFYQMLTGKSPRRMRLDQLPAEIREVLDKALEENPEDRYQSAGEFKIAIRGATAGPVESQTTDTAVDGDELLERNACPGCNATNTAAAKFCRTCGAALEVACPGCDTMNSVHSKFCSDCGADMSLPRLEGHDAEAYFNRGLAYQKLGEHQKAIASCAAAIHLNPDYANAYRNRGLSYHTLGEHQKAIADYTEAIRLNPDDALAYYNRGLAYSALREHPKAIADYDEAIRLNPDDADAYINRGWAYYNLGEDPKAIADYDEAIRLNPDDAAAYANRAIAYGRLDQSGKAIADYDEAIRLNPDLAGPHVSRGAAYDGLGEKHEAKANFAKAKELGYEPDEE